MNRKTSLAIVVMVILVSSFSIVLITTGNNPDTTMLVSPSSIIVAVNETFQIDIDVSGVPNLYGWEFKLGYNTSLLELVSITESSFLHGSRDTYFVPKVVSTDGYILAGCTSLRNVTGVSGNGTLATVEFRSRALGSCTLDLYDTKLVNSAKQLMDHVETGGTVTANGCITATIQYVDGFPRSGADVWIYYGPTGPLNIWLGITGEDGKVVNCNLALSEGDYWAKAFWPNPLVQFGPNAYLYVDENGNGSTVIRDSTQEITPPRIEILSPQNQTYTSGTVPLTFTIDDYSPISWVGYSLDSQANVTITGNTTLAGLSNGSHSIVIYAIDAAGNMGSSAIISFVVNAASSNGGGGGGKMHYMN